MKKIATILLFSFIGIQGIFAQLKTYSFEQIDSLQHIEKRKIVIFIHTDFCKYCKAMENIVFKNKTIIEKLNDNFYYITLNAEEKNTITYMGRSFVFKSNGTSASTHELAYELATIKNQTAYPTICVLNPQNEIIFQQSNYLATKDFLFLLEKLKEN